MATDDQPLPQHSTTPSLRFASAASSRLDAWLGEHVQTYSRSRWQALIREGRVRVNGEPRKPNYQLHDGDTITWEPSPSRVASLVAEDLPLEVLFEDDDLIVLNKAVGMVVHPAPGHDAGTLVNALLHYCPNLPGIGGERRPGLVHRLDRDTSGVIVVAKSEQAMVNLAEQFREHEVEKEYVALVWGTPRPAHGTVHTRIARSQRDRKKMAALPLEGTVQHGRRPGDQNDEDDEPDPAPGREAISHYVVEESFPHVSLLRVRIETGRTHQIRVHLAHLRHPVVGDTVYGRARAQDLPAPAERQMLHAEKLTITHPRTGKRLTFRAPLPADFRTLLEALRAG